MNVSLLLVTYNRISLLKEAIEAIEKNAKGISEIIIVDNYSTDGTVEYLTSYFSLRDIDFDFKTDVSSSNSLIGYSQVLDIKVKYLRLHENTGGSGGFYEGVRMFYEKSESDWVWGMDDDAFLEEGAFKELISAIEKHPQDNAFWSNCNNDKNPDEYCEVTSWMFVGFCLNKYLIDKIGLPVKDYFIYHDDSEYSQRVVQSNSKIIKVLNSKIKHGDLSEREFWKRKLLNREVIYPKMSKWKLYYYIRNDIHKNSYNFKRKSRVVGKSFFSTLKILYVNPSFFGVALLALIHGLIGKKGKVMTP